MPTRLALGALALLATSAQAADITGCWLGEEDETVIELVEGPEGIRGRVIGLAEPLFTERDEGGTPGQPRVDLNNPDIELRARAIAGMFVIEALKPRDGRWEDGRLYDPRSGRSFEARAELVSEDHLTIRGWVGLPAIGITTRWHRPASAEADTRAMIEQLEPWMPGDAPRPAC